MQYSNTYSYMYSLALAFVYSFPHSDINSNCVNYIAAAAYRRQPLTNCPSNRAGVAVEVGTGAGVGAEVALGAVWLDKLAAATTNATTATTRTTTTVSISTLARPDMLCKLKLSSCQCSSRKIDFHFSFVVKHSAGCQISWRTLRP